MFSKFAIRCTSSFNRQNPETNLKNVLPVTIVNKQDAADPPFPTSVLFDPEKWPLFQWKSYEEELRDTDDKTNSSESKGLGRNRADIVEENRIDGHAPIKTALSALMQGLHQSSSLSTSLSDIDVTLFNFHSTKFVERLINRNISSVVIVESSHIFSKISKDFARKNQNVDAYRADIATMLGVGRKKPSKFPIKLLFSGMGSRTNRPTMLNILPLKLNNKEEYEENAIRARKPHLLAVLPTCSIQRSIINAFVKHAILHHCHLPSGFTQNETLFSFGNANLLTFLSSSVLAQCICSGNPNMSFMSHQHRRFSSIFQKLFKLRLIYTRETEDSSNGFKGLVPIGHHSKSFHPPLPVPKKVAHEKKLAEMHLHTGQQYAVRISPRQSLLINGKAQSDGEILAEFAFFMTTIGKQPNAKSAITVIRNLWPESASTISADVFTEKIGSMPDCHLESIFMNIREELGSSPSYRSFVHDLKIISA